MGVWSGLGINYGHSAGLTDSQVAIDLAYLKALGFTKVRMAYPDFRTSSLASLKARTEIALNLGFYVVWGVTAGGALTATRWGQYKTFVETDIAPWAQSLSNPNFQLSIGNEEELHVDGTTIVKQNIIDDVSGSFGDAIKAVYTAGLLSYETAATERAAYRPTDSGTGSLDRIGFNV